MTPESCFNGRVITNNCARRTFKARKVENIWTKLSIRINVEYVVTDVLVGADISIDQSWLVFVFEVKMCTYFIFISQM